MVTEEQVIERLREVIDPELGVNIVDLGFVYKVSINERKVSVLMTLTSPGCPLTSKFEELVREAISKIENVSDVSVELTFDPPWTTELMSEEVKAKLGFE